MEELNIFINHLSENVIDDHFLTNFLAACTDQQWFIAKEKDELQPLISFINTNLNDSCKRLLGLQLLQSFLPQCSDLLLQDYAISWLHQCVKGIESTDANISFEVLVTILLQARYSNDLSKQICNAIIPKLLILLQKLPDKAKIAGLKCLKVVLKYYTGPCKSNKPSLEKLIFSCIDSQDVAVVNTACSCIPYLPLLCAGGAGGAGYQLAWRNLQEELCVLLRDILQELIDSPFQYKSCIEDKAIIPVLPLTEMHQTKRILLLKVRFNNLILYFKALLCGEFPVLKPILTLEIFNIICHGLSSSSSTVKKKKHEDQLVLAAVLPQYQCSLLSLLESLIICCKTNLLPFGPVINNLVLQVLKDTSRTQWPSGTSKPFAKLRENACKVLILWLQISKASSCVEIIAGQLINELLHDVYVSKTAVTLSVRSGGTKHLSKQQRKQLKNASQGHVATVQSTAPQYTVNNCEANADLCMAALKTISAIIEFVGFLLDFSLLKRIEQSVLSMLLEIHQLRQASDYPIPYNMGKCRLYLYRLLLTLVTCPHSQWLPPCQFALPLFTTGQLDQAIEVANFCSLAVSKVEKMIHPDFCPLLFPLSVNELDKLGKQQNEEQQLSYQPTPELEETDEETNQMDVCVFDEIREESCLVELSNDEVSDRFANVLQSEGTSSCKLSTEKPIVSPSKLASDFEKDLHPNTTTAVSESTEDQLSNRENDRFSDKQVSANEERTENENAVNVTSNKTNVTVRKQELASSSLLITEDNSDEESIPENIQCMKMPKCSKIEEFNCLQRNDFENEVKSIEAILDNDISAQITPLESINRKSSSPESKVGLSNGNTSNIESVEQQNEDSCEIIDVESVESSDCTNHVTSPKSNTHVPVIEINIAEPQYEPPAKKVRVTEVDDCNFEINLNEVDEETRNTLNLLN